MYFITNSDFIFNLKYTCDYLDWIVNTLLVLIPLLVSIAFFTLAERKSVNFSFIGSFIYDFFLAFKIIVLVFLFVFIRANLPRFRFDQLMFVGWKICLPVALCALFFFPGFLYSINSYEIKQYPRLCIVFNYIETYSVTY